MSFLAKQRCHVPLLTVCKACLNLGKLVGKCVLNTRHLTYPQREGGASDFNVMFINYMGLKSDT